MNLPLRLGEDHLHRGTNLTGGIPQQILYVAQTLSERQCQFDDSLSCISNCSAQIPALVKYGNRPPIGQSGNIF